MRQLTFVAPQQVEWREVAEPTIEGPLQALVRPVAVANCDLDRPIIAGLVPLPGPFALGHEFIADVVEVGEAVRAVAPGDRVVVPFQVSCGDCERCRRGLTASCLAVKRGSAYGLGPLGRGEWGGAFSDLVRVPFADAMLVPLGDLDPVALASASDNLPDAYRTVAGPLRDLPGAPVLVVAGELRSIGLYASAMAVAMGASTVDFVATDRTHLEVAAAAGARPVESQEAVGRQRYPIVVDCTGDPAGLAFCLRHVEAGGTCTSSSIYYQDVALPLLDMYTTGVTFRTGRVNARALVPEVLDLVRQGTLRPERVNTTVVSWEDAPQALLDLPTKLIVTR